MRKSTLLALFLVSHFAFAQPFSFSPRGIGGGGALFSPSINPGNPDEYFVACDMSELFHATNFGATYSQVNFTEFVGGHNSKVCYTSTSGLLYSISYINDIGTPVTSNDNGNTWSPLVGNPDANEDLYTIHVDYANSNRILISQYGAIFYSTDGGVTFTQIHTALSGNGNVVGGVLFDGTNIYVGTNDGVLVSINSGLTWNIATLTGIASTENIWSFCAAKVGNTTRFFCLTGDVNDVYVGLQGSDYWGFFRNVYTCDYGVNNWTVASNGIIQNTDFPMFIDMAEDDINVVYVAGSNNNGQPTIMRSANAGGNWSHTFNATNNANIFTGWSGDGGDRGWGYGECVFGFDVCATDPSVVVFGDYGFVHVTNGSGSVWVQAYVDIADQHPTGANTPTGDNYHSIGLENTTCWQVDWSDQNNLWACYSDIRGIRSTDAGWSWSFNYTGHTANSSYRVDRMTNGTMIMACSGYHDMYQSTRLQDANLDPADAEGQLKFSTDNGASWSALHNFNHPVFWIVIDPNNTNRAYASVIHYGAGNGVGGVYRCDDLNNLAASTWTLLPNPPRTEKHPACLNVLNDGTLVATYSGRRDALGAFTASSGVFTYNPTSGLWADVSDPDMYYWTKDLVIDENDVTQSTWYVGVFSGWGGPPNGLGGLFKTVNRGVTWTKLTGSTLDRVTSCTFNPNNANELFVTTETQGLWMSSNINAGSPTFSLVTSYPFRQPERVFFNPFDQTKMWVTSFGNGMKVGDILNGIPEFDSQVSNVFPNPANETFSINGKQNEMLGIYSIAGQLVREVTLVDGRNLIEVADLTNGVYLIRKNASIAKLIVQH